MKFMFYGRLFLFGFLTFVCFLRAENSEQSVQKLHREIGKNLVQIRRENPTLQSSIYSLLDQVSKLYRFSTDSLRQQKKLKLAMREDKRLRLSLEKEKDQLKTEVSRMKYKLDGEISRNSQTQKQVENLQKEKTELARKKDESDLKEKEYMTKVKELENTLSKNGDLASEKNGGKKNEGDKVIYSKSSNSSRHKRV